MFKCAVTGKITEPREGMNRIIVETREKVYNNGVMESKGWEIVKEITASTKGLELWNLMTEEQKKSVVKGKARYR